MVICGELCGGFVVAKNMPSFLNKSVEKPGRARTTQKQIPFGDDNQKGRSSKNKSSVVAAIARGWHVFRHHKTITIHHKVRRVVALRG
jgi:hypothetical protein